MDLFTLIAAMRRRYENFNPPAAAEALAAAEAALGEFPADVGTLYRDHDGERLMAPRRGETLPTVRLMPLAELLKTQADLEEVIQQMPSAGRVLWLWTDDASNYVGIYTDGPLRGWLAKLDHEEPVLTPAFRCTLSFLGHAYPLAVGNSDPEEAPIDVGAIPPDVPVVVDDPRYVESDRALARTCAALYADESDEERRQLWARCVIVLTPVANTAELVRWLREDDMWTPAAALEVMQLRRFEGAWDEIERLAREGAPNGDGAAMRMLAQSDAPAARAAVARLRRQLQGQKLQRLEMWLRPQD